MRVLEERCVGCAHCMPFCSNEAIEVMGIARIDSRRCTECKACIPYCPNEAIVEGENKFNYKFNRFFNII